MTHYNELHSAIEFELYDPATDYYVKLMRQLLSPLGENAGELLKDVLSDTSTSMNVKNYLASIALLRYEAQVWALEHFPDESLCKVLKDFFLDEKLEELLLKRKRLTWKVLDAALSGLALDNQRRDKVEVLMVWRRKTAFFAKLPDKVVSNIAGKLLLSCWRLNIKEEDVMSRLRKIYDLDESIPDDWVRKMVT